MQKPSRMNKEITKGAVNIHRNKYSNIEGCKKNKVPQKQCFWSRQKTWRNETIHLDANTHCLSLAGTYVSPSRAMVMAKDRLPTSSGCLNKPPSPSEPSSTLKPSANWSSCLDAPRAGTSMQWPKRTKRSGSGFLDSACARATEGVVKVTCGQLAYVGIKPCFNDKKQNHFPRRFPKIITWFWDRENHPKKNTGTQYQVFPSMHYFRHRSGNHGVRNGAARGESNDSWACPVPAAASFIKTTLWSLKMSAMPFKLHTRPHKHTSTYIVSSYIYNILQHKVLKVKYIFARRSPMEIFLSTKRKQKYSKLQNIQKRTLNN